MSNHVNKVGKIKISHTVPSHKTNPVAFAWRRSKSRDISCDILGEMSHKSVARIRRFDQYSGQGKVTGMRYEVTKEANTVPQGSRSGH